MSVGEGVAFEFLAAREGLGIDAIVLVIWKRGGRG